MAKKAAARKSAGTKTAKGARRRAAGKEGVDFKPLHDAMDAALAQLKGRKQSAKRDVLIFKLTLMRSFKMCPKMGMFAELE